MHARCVLCMTAPSFLTALRSVRQGEPAARSPLHPLRLLARLEASSLAAPFKRISVRSLCAGTLLIACRDTDRRAGLLHSAGRQI